MKFIFSKKYDTLKNIKTFNKGDYQEILSSMKSLPKNQYEVELFDNIDNKGFVLCFDKDLYIRVSNEDRKEIKKCLGFEAKDHIKVDLKKYDIMKNIKTFTKGNYQEILSYIKSLPNNQYEIEVFETVDNKSFVICFDDDLYVKVANKDKKEFEKCFGFEAKDHIKIDLSR